MKFQHPEGTPQEVLTAYVAQLRAELDRLADAIPTIDQLDDQQVHHLRGFFHYAEHLDEYMREVISQKQGTVK